MMQPIWKHFLSLLKRLLPLLSAAPASSALMMKTGMRRCQKTKPEKILPSARIQCLGCLGWVIESDGRAA